MPDTLFRPVHREIGNILKDVIEGRVGLPDLQRPFVWKNDKVRDLLDSMIKGYPIGYIMLWESPDAYTEKKAAIGDNAKSFEAPKELVIDGQQRLTALVSALFGITVKDKDFSDRTIKIAYNPITREFANWDASIQRNASFIPDISTAFAAKKANSLSAFRREFLNRLNESNEKKSLPETTEADEDNIEQGINDLLFLEQYQLPTLEILNTADEEMVSDIFVRVNSQGQSLKQDDFIMTLLSVYEPQMRMHIESFCKESHAPAEGTSYNPLLNATATLIIRATVAVGFNRGRLRYAYSILRGRDLTTKETSIETREENFTKFGAALDKVLDINNWHAFINTLGEAGYINQSQISSENAIIFSYAFYLIGKYTFNLDAIQLKKLTKRWFFTSSITSLYAGSFESVFEQELTSIKTLSSSEEFISYFNDEISSLLTEDFFSITLPNALDAKEATGPTWNAFVAAQIIQGSKILFNTVPVSQLYSLGASGSKRAVDKHHLFPDNFLKQKGYEKSRSSRANFTSLDPQTNIYISDDDPAIYVAKYRQTKGEGEYLRNCREHALPVNFERMDYMQFLEARRKLMASFIKQAFYLL